MVAVLNLQPAPGYEDQWSQTFSLPDGGRLNFNAGRSAVTASKPKAVLNVSECGLSGHQLPGGKLMNTKG